MEHALLMEMHKNIDRFISEGKLKDKFIVIFGSNEPAERIMDFLAERGIKVNGLIDNNVKKDGSELNGVEVTLPAKLLEKKIEDAVILIASKYYPEMVVQLNGMGYEEDVHILKAVEYSSFSAPSLDLNEFDKRAGIVKKGQIVFDKLMAQYPECEKIFVCPLIVLGDAYVGMSCMREYMLKNGIKNYALVVVNRACSKVASLFGFDSSLFTVSREEMETFIQFSVYSHMADGKILILNHRHPYTCRIGEIGNYKNVNFMDHFRYTILGLPEGSRPEIPSATRDSLESKEYVKRLFDENGLIYGKTVILFPYAKTAAKMSDEFWEQLTEKLSKKGFIVCTNSGGDGEPAIKGTKELFFDIRYALETIEAAGTVIGLRSGLCDVISTAKAKKIILYPDRFYGPSGFYDFFSLNKMELCDDAIELVMDNGEEDLVERILNQI